MPHGYRIVFDRWLELSQGIAVLANGFAASPLCSIATCDICAAAVVRAAPRRLEALRRDPGQALRPAALRHADDQSVVGLAAVLAALRAANMTADQCADWVVVAAPRFLGRIVLAAALRRFAAEGAWCVSPHILPQQSQHAVAGLISQILGIQGPSLGVGGGPGVGAESALTATALLQGNQMPGAWLVITGWNQEPIPDEQGCLPPHAECQALALGLTPTRASQQRPQLCVCPDLVLAAATAEVVAADQTWFTCVEQLERAMHGVHDGTEDRAPAISTSMIWPLSRGTWIEMVCARQFRRHDRDPQSGLTQAGRSVTTPAHRHAEEVR